MIGIENALNSIYVLSTRRLERFLIAVYGNKIAIRLNFLKLFYTEINIFQFNICTFKNHIVVMDMDYQDINEIVLPLMV